MGRSQRDKGARFEREVAEALNTCRVSVQGRSDKNHADVEHDYLWVQCKRRARLSIFQWWEETREAASQSKKQPVLVVRQDRGEALAIIDLKTFRAMLDNIEKLRKETFLEDDNTDNPDLQSEA